MKTIALLLFALAATTLACSSNASSSGGSSTTAARATATERPATAAASSGGAFTAQPAPATPASALVVTPASGTAAAPSSAAVSFSQPPGDPQGWQFAPATVSVRVGGTVTWTNPAGNEIHTVTADNGAFDSGVLSAGDTFKQTFAAAGAFAYHCTLHAWMKGVINVVQ